MAASKAQAIVAGQVWEHRLSATVTVLVTEVTGRGTLTIQHVPKGRRYTLSETMFRGLYRPRSGVGPRPARAIRKSAKGTLDASEGVLVKSTLARLNLMPGVCAWRNNTGALRVPGKAGKKERFVRFGALGSGDIFVVVRGRFLSLEAKSATGRLRASQVAWKAHLTAAGGYTAVYRTVDEAVKAVEEVKRLSA